MSARSKGTSSAHHVARFGTIGFTMAAVVLAIVFPPRRFEIAILAYLSVPSAVPLLYSGLLRFIDPSIPFIVPVYSYTSITISGSPPETVRHRRGSKTVHTTRTRAGIRLGIGLAFATFAIVMIMFAATARPEPTTSVARARPLPAPAPKAVPTSLAEALAVAPRSLALDSPLVGYASAKLAWTDVATADTTIGRALKDAEAERGKRLCASGTIDQIQRRDAGGRRVYTGRLETADRDVVDFVAVGTTGDLVKRSAATLCGIVVGAPGQAVAMVGMFDLPENRHPIVEQ